VPKPGKTELRIGQRVELTNCTRCAAGTVTGYSRNRIQVTFDDMPQTRWLLRPEALQLVQKL
jgi:hypothetical protein